MKLLSGQCAAGVIALLIGVSTASSGECRSNMWSLARNKGAGRQAQKLAEVEAIVSGGELARETSSALRRRLLLLRSLRLLEHIDAADSSDSRQRQLLAETYQRLHEVDGDEPLLEKAVFHFQAVARLPGPVQRRASALSSLAICFARLGKHAAETKAYSEALAVEPDPIGQAMLLANQAEGFMAGGAITKAVNGYRRSLELTPSPLIPRTGTTTLWGLSVALDRAGDLEAALAGISTARTYDPDDTQLNGPNWFYVPPYDEAWYKALGFWQLARDSDDSPTKHAAFRAALASWRAYLVAAAKHDRWLPLARLRLDQCQAELEASLKQAQDRLLKGPKDG